MSWYDSIGAGLGGVADMFAGSPSGSTAAAAPVIANGAQNMYDNTDFGKATGLAPFMKMLGMGSTPPVEPAPTRMATPLEQQDAAAGHFPHAGGSTSYTNKVAGTQESKSQNYFGKTVTKDGTQTTEGGFNLPNVQNWDAAGRSNGNRQGDIDAREGPDGKAAKPITVGAPEVYQADLSKIHRTFEGQATDVTGAGHFAEHAYGSKFDSETDKSGFSGSTKFNPGTGKGTTSIYSTGYQAGIEEKKGYRASAISDNKLSKASAEAGLVANAGVSGSVGLDTKNGLYATGGVGAKSGFYASADASTKTDPVLIGGQSYDAGIGVHGDTYLGAKAGASGTLGIGPDYVGAKGNIGAFVGEEAAGDIHGNFGPLGGKLGASGMVGAGAGADGDISYKDGKLHIGGKAYACIGYGGSLSADATIDFGKIAKTLGPAGAAAMDLVGAGIVGGANVLGGAVHGAYDVSKGVVNGAVDVADGVGQGFNDVYGGIDRGAADVGTGIVHGLSDIGSGIGTGVSDIAHGNIIAGLGDIGGGLVHGVGDLASGVGHGLYDVGSGIVHGVGEVASGIGHGLYDVGSGIVSGVGDVASGIGRGASAIVGGVGSAIGHVLSW